MARSLRRLLPVLAVLGVALLLAGDVVRSRLERESFHDWDHHVAYLEAAAASVRRHHELPLWNPYPCGGTPLLGNPQARLLTPFFLLYLVLPPAFALKWDIALHFLLAVLGMVVLVREQRGPLAAALVGALVFGGSTFFSLHLAEGHTWILSAAYAPFVLAFYERGLDRRAWAGLAGAFLALMVGEAGIYPAPHLALFLGLYAAVLALTRRSLQPLLRAGLVYLVAALLAAPKVLPMLAFMRHQPRHIDSEEVLPLRAILHALTDRHQALDRSFDWPYWPWHEQGSYVGLLALLLAGVALLTAERRSLVLGGLAVLFGSLAAGAFAPWAPWALLHELPVFRSHHVPSRFLVMVVLAVAVLAARGTDVLLSWCPSSRLRTGLATLLVLLVGADVLSARAGILGPLRCPMARWPQGAPVGEPLVTMRWAPAIAACGASSGLAPAVRAGVAIIEAYEPLCPRERVGLVGRLPGLTGVDEPGYRGEAWLEGSGQVEIAARTQHTLTLRVSPDASGVVILNQNWDEGWRSDGGRLFQDANARLALSLEPHPRTYTLRYRPPFFLLSVALCLMGLLLLGVLWRRERPRGIPTPP